MFVLFYVFLFFLMLRAVHVVCFVFFSVVVFWYVFVCVFMLLFCVFCCVVFCCIFVFLWRVVFVLFFLKNMTDNHVFSQALGPCVSMLLYHLRRLNIAKSAR